MLPNIHLIKPDGDDGNNSKWLLLDNGDIIARTLKSGKQWSKLPISLASILLKQTASKPTILDIGANLGSFAIPMGQMLDSHNGTIMAFEPQRIIFQQLCANIFVNRLDNVYSYNMALGNYDGHITVPELDIYKSMNPGGVSLDSDIDKKQQELMAQGMLPNNYVNKNLPPYHAPIKRLDDVLGFHNINHIAFIKIDVEGLELEVFEGAVNSLRLYNFPPIFYEVWNLSWYNDKAAKTNKFLQNLGYNLTNIGDDVLALHPDHPIQMEVEFKDDGLKVMIIHN